MWREAIQPNKTGKQDGREAFPFLGTQKELERFFWTEVNSFLSSSFITGMNKAGPGCYANFVHGNSLSVTFLMAIHF